MPETRFRVRGQEMTRVETFTDAAFAFALTLLVISIDEIPASYSELLESLKQVPAFAASFATIMIFWYAHDQWSRRYGLNDPPSVLLSFVLVFLVLVFVYPLKMIFSGAFAFFTDGYLPSRFHMETIDDVRGLFVIYGTAFAALSLVIVALNRHALRKRDALKLSVEEAFMTGTVIGHWWVYTGVALGSGALALLLPGPQLWIAGMFYATLGIFMPLYHHRRETKFRSLAAGADPD